MYECGVNGSFSISGEGTLLACPITRALGQDILQLNG